MNMMPNYLDKPIAGFNTGKEAIEYFSTRIKTNGFKVCILIYVDEPIERTASGIYIPDIAKNEGAEYSSSRGMVLQIGPEAYQGENFPSGPYCKPGDGVLFPRASSIQLKRKELEKDFSLVFVDDCKIFGGTDDLATISK